MKNKLPQSLVENITKFKTFVLWFIFVATVLTSGCKKNDGASKETVDVRTLTGQIFTNRDGQNVMLGGVKVVLFDQQQMWNCLDTHAVEWSNNLAAAQSNVDLATSNLDALYKDDFDKLTAAKKGHDKTLETATPGSPEWQHASEWSLKLEKKLADLEITRLGSPAGQQLHHDLLDRRIKWDLINWPPVIMLQAADLMVQQSTTADADGRFKFVIPASSPNLVLFAKVEESEKGGAGVLWINAVETPAGGKGTNFLRSMERMQNGTSWYTSVNLNQGTTEIILSDNNREKFGIWHLLENTNIANYMLRYSAIVETARHDPN